jgi:hypothetical protein
MAGAWCSGRGQWQLRSCSAAWGDVPTWALAVTTLLAFVGAVFAGLVAYELLRVELDRDQVAVKERRRQEAERAAQREAGKRAQASRVAAWHGTWMSVSRRSRDLIGGPQEVSEWPRWGAIIRNGSDLPVYDARVSFCVPVDAAAGLTWRDGERWLPDPLHVVPPGEEHVEIRPDIAEAAAGSEPKWLIAVEFTDADNVRWLRDSRRKLGPV